MDDIFGLKNVESCSKQVLGLGKTSPSSSNRIAVLTSYNQTIAAMSIARSISRGPFTLDHRGTTYDRS
jgi:hypothetical protein